MDEVNELVGKKMVYREDGWVAEVEVVSVVQEGAGEKKTLKCIKTMQESGYIKPEAYAKDGEVFSVWAARGFEHYAGWTLNFW
jgi:hypothetical protein